MRFLIILSFLFFLIISCAPRVSQKTYVEIGLASYYGNKFKGRRTASGEIFDPEKLTAAHPRLPFNTYVKVTNLENGRSVIVRINDRGPSKNGRIIDVSQKAAEILGFKDRGTCKVKIEVVSWP